MRQMVVTQRYDDTRHGKSILLSCHLSESLSQGPRVIDSIDSTPDILIRFRADFETGQIDDGPLIQSVRSYDFRIF